MPFVLFHDLFPEVAEEETRTLRVLGDNSQFDFPPGDYSFAEMFCNEKGCDCRRVLFWVVSITQGGPVAVINWGWEHESFYAKWMRGGHRELAKDLKGPSLNIGSPQSDLAPAILDLTESVLLTDKAYRDRVKRHYKMFRKEIDGRKCRR